MLGMYRRYRPYGQFSGQMQYYLLTEMDGMNDSVWLVGSHWE